VEIGSDERGSILERRRRNSRAILSNYDLEDNNLNFNLENAMKTERSIFGEHGPAGFPNQSAIRERLIEHGDTTAVEPWATDFDAFAAAVLKTVRMTGRCTNNQANVLALECMTAAGPRKRLRRYRRRKTDAR
jgi:hypothetical protein